MVGRDLARLKLACHPAKTRVVGLSDGSAGFDFLGFHFRRTPMVRRPARRAAKTWPRQRPSESRMTESLPSGSMRGGWNRSSEVQAIYAPAGNRRRPLAGPPEPPRQPPTPPNLVA